MLHIEIANLQDELPVAASRLEDHARYVLSSERVRRASLSLALVDDRTIQRLNRTFLGHDWPTDVLSFPLGDPDDAELSGEIVISAERALAEARDRRVEPMAEVLLYLTHGLLHLCGYDDRTPRQAARMHRREAELLGKLGIVRLFENETPEAPVQAGKAESRPRRLDRGERQRGVTPTGS